jgi:hypothetical protein
MPVDMPGTMCHIVFIREGDRQMTTTEITNWLTYWNNARMVAVENIAAFDQVHLARKFCECMRVGVFHPDMVTDLQIWNAIREMRKVAA